MGGVVAAIPDRRAVGSALLRPRPRAVGSSGRAGHTAHSTVVHGSATAHAAEAMPPRLPGHHRLALAPSSRKAPAPLRSALRYAHIADFSRPHYPLTGALPLAHAPVGIGDRATLPTLGAGLPSRPRYTRGSLRTPAGQPPRTGLKGVPDGLRCWRTAVAGPVRTGGQAAHARARRGAGVGRRTAWGQRVPTPLAGRCAPWSYVWSFTGRAVCC
jgi:hypothetical protein